MSDSPASEPNQAIFDQRFQSLTNGFGEACEQNGVNLAIAIAIHPEEEQPIIFARGHQFDIAVLMSRILKQLKAELTSRLE